MAEIKMKLKTPSVPNFIVIETTPGKREDGFKEAPTIRVGDLSNETLEEIAEDWKRALFENAARQRLLE